jgi:hypothetical protein
MVGCKGEDQRKTLEDLCKVYAGSGSRQSRRWVGAVDAAGAGRVVV